MRDVSEIDDRWLIEIAPHFYEDNKGRIHKEKHIKEIEVLNKNEEKKKEEPVKEPEIRNLFLGSKKNKFLTKNQPKEKPKPTSRSSGGLSFELEEMEEDL